MATERTLLLIADIGGYTRYMRKHRMSLAHAQINTARLLEKVIDAAPGYDLVEIEGDAAFVSRPAGRMPADEVVPATLDVAAAMHRAFHAERQYVAANLCPCNGCAETDELKLKFVAHVGEVAVQTIRTQRKLVGLDVIHVHRMLKNTVDIPEYVLLSEELYASGAPDVVGKEVHHDLEGIGPVRSYFVDVTTLPGPPVPVVAPSLLSRVGQTLTLAGTGLPLMLGLGRRRAATA